MGIRLLAACMAVSAGLAGCAQVRVSESHFIRPDAPGTVVEQRYSNAAASELSVAGSDGALLHGILFEQPGARSTVLYFGGNMFHLDQHANAALPLLAACGSNVAMFDYRGYGRSSGKPTVATMQADALALFDALNARFPGRVIVHGQSLGSFMAAHVAQARPVAGTVLETTATSVEDLVHANVPWYAWPFVRIEMEDSLRQVDNRTAAARFSSAALVIAAGQDRTTPPRLGKKVFDAIPRQDKQYLLLDQAGHNGALRTEGAGAAYCGFIGKL
ncbi:alpha/beta hydrolase [Massilia suwonensis]|uniref:Alpha/beta hydrolase n=1 Tax=Massilia suwonensis TaxID=648895 RepID=A0ABW0MH15_9BURK